MSSTWPTVALLARARAHWSSRSESRSSGVSFAISFANHDYWATGLFILAMIIGVLLCGATSFLTLRRYLRA